MENTKSNRTQIKAHLFKNEDINTRPDIVRLKRAFGISYGVVIGLTFSVSTWGADGLILSQSHMFLPWLKLIIGSILCGLTAGLAGWVTARLERWYFTLLAWVGVAVFFAWLLIALPLQINPLVSSWFRPEWKGLIKYETFEQLSPRFFVALMWIAIFVLIAGAIQIPFIEPAAFSVSVLGKIAPFLLGMVMIGLGGIVTDSLNNQPLRMSVVALNHSIQFLLDNKDANIDPAVSRANRAGAVRSIKDQLTSERSMTISGYDPLLGEIDVIVQFQDLLADCKVIYEQPAFCKPATQN